VSGVALDLVNDPVERHIRSFIEAKKKTKLPTSNGVIVGNDFDSWTSKDFFRYFCDLYEDKFGRPYKFGNGSLPGILQRIKGFIDRSKLPHVEYVRMINYLFDEVFSTTYVPTVGNICSTEMMNTLPPGVLQGKRQKGIDFESLQRDAERK